MKKSILILILLSVCVLPVIAQQDTIPAIIADRPTQAISPYLVQKRFFQIETGAIYTNRTDDFSDSKNLSLATTLLRYGILQRLELRLESSFESTTIDSTGMDTETSYSGMGPLTAGFKVFVCKEKGIRPALAIIGSVTLRHIGSDNYAPTFSYPTGKLAASHTLSKKWSLGYNVGFSYNGETADGYFVYSVFTGYQITDHLWSFVEVYGRFDNGDFPKTRFDGGFTYLVRKNLQIDLTGGYGQNNEINRYFINAGLSWRIPR